MKNHRFTPEDVPRLNRGKYRMGPEFHGCCNTGTRPVLFFGMDCGTEGKRPYIVCGSENLLFEARMFFTMNPRKRIFRAKHGATGARRNMAWAYATRKPAVERFVELSNERLDENARVRARSAAAREAVCRGDRDTALALSDYL